MSTRPWAGILLALALTACGGGTDVATEARIADPGPSSTTTSDEPSTTRTVAPRPTVGPTTSSTSAPVVEQVTEVSPLSRKDVPPGGVADQFTTGTLALVDGCDAQPNDPDGVTILIGEDLLLCVYRTPYEGWTWQLRFPDGHMQQLEGPEWESGLSDPVGAYQMIGEGAGRKVSVPVEVALRSKPTILSPKPDRAPAGASFAVGLAGFAAGSRAQPDLYRFVRRDGAIQTYEFVTALDPVRINSRGEALVTIPSRAGDPAGGYCVTIRDVTTFTDGPNKCPTFTVGTS